MIATLKKARALVEAGWIRGTYYSYASGCYCAAGAIRESISKHLETEMCVYANPPHEVFSLFKEFIDHDAELDHPEGCLIAFNDNLDTTKEDVLAVFDRVIAKLEAQGG